MENEHTHSRRAFLGASAGAGLGLAATESAQAARGAASWEARRKAIRDGWLGLLGPFPEEVPALDPEEKRVADIEGIECRHVTFQSEPDDRVPAYLLIPKAAKDKPSPAVITIHSTTQGAGKRLTVGLSGRRAEDAPLPPPHTRAYGLELARWGYVTLSIDLICDGERIPEGLPRYDTRVFYEGHPEWSGVGKNTWDLMRAMDYLQTLDCVDGARVACCGHSLGGHMSLFAAAFDERVAAAACNGGVYSWRRNEDHWSRPETEKPEAVTSYIYIKKFRPYLDDASLPVPADFDGLMMLVAPRPLLIMQAEFEFERDGTVDKVDFYANEDLIGTDTSDVGGWQYDWSVPMTTGEYTLTAEAFDDTGLSTNSAPVDISIIAR